jgi:hypothetical protein
VWNKKHEDNITIILGCAAVNAIERIFFTSANILFGQDFISTHQTHIYISSLLIGLLFLCTYFPISFWYCNRLKENKYLIIINTIICTYLFYFMISEHFYDIVKERSSYEENYIILSLEADDVFKNVELYH